MLMSFYTTTLVPILGVMIAIGMVVFLAYCWNRWAGKYYTVFREKRTAYTTQEGEKE